MSGTGNSKFVDYYKLLGIMPDAESRLIRASYIQKAKQHHPDAGGSVEAMQLLNRAYRTLMSASAKAAYDMMHGMHTGTAANAYKYAEVSDGGSVAGMSDDEIDKFLDTMLAEFRHGVPKPKKTLVSKFLDLF